MEAPAETDDHAGAYVALGDPHDPKQPAAIALAPSPLPAQAPPAFHGQQPAQKVVSMPAPPPAPAHHGGCNPCAGICGESVREEKGFLTARVMHVQFPYAWERNVELPSEYLESDPHNLHASTVSLIMALFVVRVYMQ